MRNLLVGLIWCCSALCFAQAASLALDLAQRNRAETEQRRQEQRVAAWERDGFNDSISKAARTCAAVRVRCSVPWLVLEGQVVPGGPWVELGRVRASVYEGKP